MCVYPMSPTPHLSATQAYHTLGAIQECVNRGAVLKGMNILLTSNVPHGAGMSNSAANCVALGLVFNAIYPTLKLDEKIDVILPPPHTHLDTATTTPHPDARAATTCPLAPPRPPPLLL